VQLHFRFVPTISVIIPAFHAQGTLARAVRSVLDQTFQNWEAIVVADDEMDYANLLRRSGVEDPRIRFITTGRVGSGCHNARNAGFAAARGDFIAALDADDLFLPSRLAALLPIARKEGAAVDNIRVVDDVTGREVCRGLDGSFEQRSLDVTALLDASVPFFPLVAREYSEPRLAGIEFAEDVVANLRLIDRLGSLTVIGKSLSEYRLVHESLSRGAEAAEKFEQSYSHLIERLSNGDGLGLAEVNVAPARAALMRKRDLNRAFALARKDNRELDFQSFAAAQRRSAAARQNGISSSMSSCLPPALAIAGLRSREAVGPGEPKSPLSEPAPPPARSSMVSAELKPCSTTSVE
jgi:succinoglycan biosynthesis protein ExoO